MNRDLNRLKPGGSKNFPRWALEFWTRITLQFSDLKNVNVFILFKRTSRKKLIQALWRHHDVTQR